MPRFVETLRVVHAVPHRFLAAVFTVGSCALAAGCLSGDSSRGGSGGSGADAAHSRSRQNDAHPTDDPSSSAYRVELRPKVSGQPIRGSQVLIATLYDDRGTPSPNQRVEWSLDGPGTITEVDEGPRTGPEIRSAISRTSDAERSLIRGGAEFTIRPGQSWCVVTSPTEGETTVSVHAAGTDGPRARSTVRWGGDGAQFPKMVTARAGGDYTLSIKVPMGSDTPASFRVRYRILDGPAAALTLPDGRPAESVTEATTSPAPDGSSTIRISQPVAAAGTNRIAIQILRPNPADPSGYSTVSQGETAVTWKRPDVTIAVSAAKAVALNEEFLVTYSVGPKDAARDQPVTVTATIPRGAEVVRTEPNASRSGDQLVWNLREDGTTDSPGVSATYRAVAAGPVELAAEVRTQDGRSGRSSTSVRVTEPKLLLKLDGPKTGLAGDTLPFKLVVTNVGDGPAEKVRVRARLDDGAEAANRAVLVDETIGTLAPGQAKTTSVPIT
ncbi:MAG TPA: hypothetical protein VKD90_18330, partial [Gemmataceae bacterium]|nr:hypothetical protein [Gemmataceae bacterium]